MKILSIAIGGAAGAVARYLITVSPLSNVLQPFPLPTFLINVTGSFLIGVLLVLFADKFAVSENVRSALVGASSALSRRSRRSSSNSTAWRKEKIICSRSFI